MVELHTNNYDHRFNVYLISLSITITRRHVTHLTYYGSAFLPYSDTITIQLTLLTPSYHL